MPFGTGGHGGAVYGIGALQQFLERAVDPAVVAAGVRAAFRTAVAVGKKADFILGGQGNGFKNRAVLPQPVDGAFGAAAGIRFGGQIKEFFDVSGGQGGNSGINGGNGLADPGRRLAKQASAVLGGICDGVHHLLLAGPPFGKRKGQFLKRGVPLFSLDCSHDRPAAELFEQMQIKRFQLGEGKAVKILPLLLGHHLKIG